MPSLAALALLLAAAPTPRAAIEARLATGARAEVEQPRVASGGDCPASGWEALREVTSSGLAPLRFTGTGADGRPCQGHAWAPVTVLARAAVATRPLADGDPLEGAVAFEERPVRPGRRPSPPPPPGATAARRLPAGAVLAEPDYRTGPRPGDAVPVLVRVGSLTVEQPGRAVACARDRACARLPSGRLVEGPFEAGRILVEAP